MTEESDSPLKFPCEFPIKIMGREEADFESHVRDIVAQNVPAPDVLEVRRRESSNDRFVSITVRIMARSRAQLDTLYRELTGDTRILFVL